MTNGSKVDALKELSKYIKDGIIDDVIYQAYVDAAKAYGATQKEIEDAIQSGKKAIETAQKTSHEAVQVAKNAEKIATQSAELISSVNKTQSIVEEKLAKLSRRVKREQENLNRKIIKGPVFEAVPSQYSKEAYEKEHKYVHTGKTKYKTKQIIPGSEVDLNKIRKMSVTQIAGVLTGNKFGDYSEEAIKAMETELKAMKGKELTGEYLDLKNKIVSAKNAAKQIGDAARRGTAFHKIAELLESGNLAIEQLTEAKIKSLAEDYSEIQEGIDGETEKDINYNVKRLKAMASDYEKLKKQAGLQGKPTTEKSLGFLAQIGDEIVEITGTFDSFFSQLGTLLDFKTTATIDPKKIGIQLNLLKKAIELHGGDVSSLQALHIPFRMGGRAVTSESSVYNVGTVDDVVMQDWIEKAFKGVAAEVPTLLKSVLEPYSWTKGKQTKSSWMLNKIPISKLPSMIKQGRLDEIVGMVQGLSPEEQKHFLNLIWSTKEYGEGKPVGGVESDKLYRRGREWDKLRRALPSFYTGLKTATGISEETFIDEEGNVSGATTVGGGFLSQWSKAYRLKLAEGGEKAAQTVVDQFVKIVRDSTDEIGRDEIFGKLSSLSFKDDIHDSFIDAVDKSLFGEGGSSFYSGNNAERVSELKTEVETLVKKQEEISKSAAEQGNVYTDEQLKEYRLLSERIESLNTEIEKLSYGYSKELTGVDQVGINERSKEENAARAIRSQKRAGERYYREQGALMRRLSQFEEGASQLYAKTPEQVLGFVKGIGSLKSIFQGALNELDGEGLSQLNEAGMPEFIENSEYLLDRWYQFVRTIKEKINPIAQDMVDVARQTGDWSKVNALNSTLNNLTLTEDTSSLATKAAQKFSWLYQAKDIYDEMLSEEEPVKSGTLSVEEWAAQRLTPEQYGQYADSMRVKEIVSKSGGNFENFITDFLKISYDTMNSELTKRVRDAVEKIKNETPELLTGKFLDIILKQTDIAGGESAKMQWWHEHSALEYLKRGETIGVFPEEKKYEDAGKAIVALEEKIERLNDAIAETTERYEGLSEGLSVNEKLFAEEYKTKNKLEGSTDPKSIIKKFDELIGIDAYLEKRKQLLDFAKTHNIKVDKDFLSGNAEGPWMARLRDDGSERVRKYNEQQDKNWDEYIRIVDEFTEANDAIKAAAKAGGMARLLTLRKELIKDEETVRRAQMGIDTSKTGKVKEIINTLSQTVEGLRLLRPASEEKIQTAQVETPKANINADTVIIGEPESPTVAEAEPPTTESVPVKKKTTRKRRTTKKSSRKNDGVDVVPDGGGIGGDGIPPQLDGSEILNELKGIHKDTSLIDSKLQSGVVLSDDDGRATSQTTSRATSIKPTDKVKKYLEYSKTISDLRVKQQKEESSLGKNKYEVMIEAYQKLQKDLGDFTDDEKLLIQEKEKEIEQNQQLKLSEVEIAAAKKQTKQEAKDAAQAEKDRVKSEKDAATQTAKTAKEYQRYLDQRFSILSKIESAQAQYNISTGKERIAAEGVITQRKIELDYLDQKNSDLIETMANTQKATKADLDYAQSLRVASMQQEKLLSKKGAKSLWDVMGNDIKRAAIRVTDFGLAAKIMNKLPQDLQKIVQYTKELDKAMTNVRIVGGYTAEQAKVLTTRYTELGRTLGATTTEIAEGMDTWLRQGYEAQDQLESLVSASTKLSKLGMISASEATTALTSALKAFNLAAEDAIKVVDKLTKVDQLAAVSAGGISEALQKSATSAKLAGMSMDELIGSVSVIGEVTQQSMDTVGNAMKSILARYGNVKASVFTQMGLNDEGETSENINDIEKVLSKLGIRMRSSSTELRDITDVLDEVNEKWDTYDTVTKNALATAFGGTRMRENFLVLMENWDRVKELTEESANAAGTADEKYSAYMDSIEAATKRLQNAWESMSQKFESSWLIKAGTNVLAGFIGHFDTLVKLVTTFASVKFSDQIFGFAKSTVLGAPNFFKKLLGFGDGRQRQITYDANGNPVINPAASGTESTLAKLQSGTTQAVQTSNSLLQQILAQLKTNGSGIVNPEYDASGKITNGLAINGRRVVVKTTKSGKSAYYYENGGMVRSSANIQKLNAQQAAITKYNAQIGTAAAQNQISGYTGRTWVGYARQVNIGDRAYYRLKDGSYVTETGEVLPVDQQKNVDEINKQLRADKISQRAKQGVTAGLTTAISELMTTKEVGSGIGGTLGKLFTGNKDNEQTIEETAGGKALRTALAGGLSGVLGAYFGPLGAMVGQIAGEGISGIISTIVHRSELEMKQRVADAKENLSKLSEVQSSIDENSGVMRKAVLEGDDEKQLEKYVDTIRDFFIDNTDFISSFLEKFGGEYGSVSAVLKDINSEDVDFRSKVEAYFEETVSELKTSNTLASQEEDRAKIAELYGLDIQGITLEEKLASAKQTVRELKDAGYTKGPIEYYESIVQKLEKAIIQEEKLNKEWLESAAQEGYLKSEIKKLSKTDLTKLGLEGAISAIADQMEQQGIGVRTDGKIHKDVYDIIKAAIKEDTEISSALERGSLTIGEYIQDSTTYADRIKQFALAFSITEEEALKMGKTFKDLTIELGNMTPSDVLEYYQKFSDVLSEVTSSGGLTAKTLNTIVKELPRLTPYIFQGTDALESEIYKAILGGEMDLVYENALNSQIFSNEGVFEYFKTQYSNLSNAAKEKTSLLGLKELIESGEATEEDKKAYYDFISNKEVEYQKDLTVQNQLREYQISLMNDEVNNLEEQKSALSDINEQRKKEIDYIKAKNALEDARKEKKRVFRSGIGWSYEVDETAISEAKEKVDSLQVERDQEAIQYQIDAINAQKTFLEALPDQAQNERLKTLMDEFTKGDDSMLERVKKLSDAFADATKKVELNEPSEDNNKSNNTIEAKTTPTSAIKAQVSGLGGAWWDNYDSEKDKKLNKELSGLGYTSKGFRGFDYFELTYNGKKYEAGSYNHGVTDISLIKNLNKSYGNGTPIKGEVIYYEDPNGTATGLYTYNNKNDWRKVVLFDGLSDDDPLKQYVPNASGTTSFPGGQTLINELGTEAVITPGGTLTALPSKTGIVPADITRNVWALGEVAPTLIARLGSLTQKPLAGNAANTTYEEGQYIDNLTMNVYPAKGDDFNKILEQARAQVRLTRRNN